MATIGTFTPRRARSKAPGCHSRCTQPISFGLFISPPVTAAMIVQADRPDGCGVFALKAVALVQTSASPAARSQADDTAHAAGPQP